MSTPDLEIAVFARCPVCAEATFPVHELPPCGHDAGPVLAPLEEAGEVFSWTRTHQGDDVTAIAMTDFLGGELRITAPVLGATDIAIGDHLRAMSAPDGAFFLVPQA